MPENLSEKFPTSGLVVDFQQRGINLSSGYDDGLYAEHRERLTQEELVEVADRMIARWTSARAHFAAGGLTSNYANEIAWEF